PHLVLRQVRKAEPGQSRIQSEGEVIEYQLPFDPDLQLTPAFLEFPRVESAIGRQPDVDAVVGCKVLRLLRPRPSCEVGRRSDDRHAEVRANAHGDHVPGYLLTETNAGVITLGD